MSTVFVFWMNCCEVALFTNIELSLYLAIEGRLLIISFLSFMYYFWKVLWYFPNLFPMICGVIV